MEIKVISNAEKNLIIEIENEDLSIPEIIHHELLKDEHVLFAGFREQHPLLKKINMRIQTKDVEPLNALISSCSKAIENTSNLLSKVKDVLTKEGE
ncbi:MAG: RpoL/Rpb11 RNA polymerase subunit family protein [Nitrososphaerales archaeon]